MVLLIIVLVLRETMRLFCFGDKAGGRYLEGGKVEELLFGEVID